MNQAIVDNEVDMLCYRLRTARQRKRAAHKDFEKKLIRLDKEERKLYSRTRELGWVELNPPVMRGWKRFFVLREDVAKGKNADFFQGMLDRINTTGYSNRKDFKKKKKECGKKIYVLREQQLNYLSEWELQRLNLTRKELEFFEERILWSKSRKKFYKIYVFKEPWRFVLRTRPNMITKTRVRVEALENRLDEIDSYLKRNCLRPKQSKLMDGYYYGRQRYNFYLFDVNKERRAFRNVPLANKLDGVREG